MRPLAVLVAVAIALSGCTVSIDQQAPDTVTHESTSSCTKSVNGVTRPCSNGPSGPRENVSIDERAPMPDRIDKTWSFSVHDGANVTAVRFALEGHDGGDVSVAQSPGCIKLTGPFTRSAGTCSNGGVTVNMNGAIISTGPRVLIDETVLPIGDYTLSAEIPRALADYHVIIDVHY